MGSPGGASAELPRSLDADGSRLFFTAGGPLVARDTNGKSDVYEYEDGRPYLITTGTSTADSQFLDAGTNGNDVFFTTEQPLVPSDIDGTRDVYDARVDGGFSEAPPPAPCAGDACRPPLSGVQPEQSPGSFVFSGPGNQTAIHGAAAPPKKAKKPKRTKKCKKAHRSHSCRKARHASKSHGGTK